MNKFFALTKVLLKSGTVNTSKSKNKKLKGIVLYILLALCFTPLAISIGALSGEIYGVLAPIKQEGTLLLLALTATCIIILFFGIFYVLSVYYFTKDIESLLPLPLSPIEILGSKFLVTLIFEYLVVAIFLLPVLVEFGIKSSGGILYYLASFLVFLTIPVISLVIASILAMIVMRFTNLGKNKDRFKVISSVVLILGIFFFNTYVNKFAQGNSSPEKLKVLLGQGNNSLISTITTVFINAKLATYVIIKAGTLEGLGDLLVYLGLNGLSLALFLILAQGIYFKGVIGLNQATSKRTKLTSFDLDKGTESSSSLKALFIKELKILYRTPIYFINCILMNFLWPIFILFPFMRRGGIGNLQKLGGKLSESGIGSIAIAIAFGVSIFIAAMNCITSTSISREGQNLFFMKYIPISYKKQINAKLLSGMMFGAIGVGLMIIIAEILVKPNFNIMILVIIVSFIGIIFSCETGMLLDLYFPKLIWDNEQKAVKQNLNVVVNMLLSFIFAGLSIFLVVKLQIQLIYTFIFIFIIFGLVDIFLYTTIMNLGIKRLKDINN